MARVAFVTGGTRGIGKAISARLKADGMKVAAGYSGNDAAAVETAKELDIMVVKGNVGNFDDCVKAAKAVEEVIGPIDVLVNNAGIQHTARVEAFPPERWEQILAINLSAAFHAIRAALPGMQARNFGRIVNIASVHGLVASKEKSAYVAAKHGVLGLTKVVALEVAQSNITCNAICPGWVHTPLVQKQVDDRAAREGISVAQAQAHLLGEKQPSKRFASISDLADTVVFLASPAGASITGISLPVDGGWTAQ